MAQIVRPVAGKLRVRLPYRPGGANYALLRGICGTRTQPEWNGRHRYFEVARAHLQKLIAQLPDAIGEPVEVILEGASQTRCVSACWAANPDSRWGCVCSCAGSNHGTGRPLRAQVSAELSVETEYTTSRHMFRPRR